MTGQHDGKEKAPNDGALVTDMKVLFLGGPGNISDSAIAYFVHRGTEVAVLKRSRNDLLGYEDVVTFFLGDRDREEVLVDALTQFRPDVVVDSTCFETRQAEAVVRALRQVPCRRLVFVSTADVYGYPLSTLPMREDDPWNEPIGQYATQKKAIEELYAEAFRGQTPGLTIVRPGYALGKTFSLTAFGIRQGAHLVTRIREGRPVYSPGDGTTLLDAGAAHNIGLMIARICENDNTIGQDYNCAHHKAVTYDEYIQAFAEAVGKPATIVHIPTDFMFSLGREEVEHSLLGGLTKFNLHFSVEKFRSDFPDFEWEYSLADAARDFIDYQESVGGFDGAGEPTFEDAVIELWLEGLGRLREHVLDNLDP